MSTSEYNITGLDCHECGPVRVRALADNMRVILYPAGDMISMWKCGRCGAETSEFMPQGIVVESFLPRVYRQGVPVIVMPAPEHPAEANYPPVEWDDLIDWHVNLDLELSHLFAAEGRSYL